MARSTPNLDRGPLQSPWLCRGFINRGPLQSPWLCRGFIAPLVLAVALLLGSCRITNAPLDAGYPGPLPLPADVAARYDYPRGPVVPTVEVLETRGRYVHDRVEIRWGGFGPPEASLAAGAGALSDPPPGGPAGDPRTQTFEYYESRVVPRPGPALLVLPILGGDYGLSRHLAAWFAERGYHALVVHRPQDLLDPASDASAIERSMRVGVVDCRRALDWLLERPEVDPRRVGALGISLGGIACAILSAVEPRLRASVIIMAGGDLPDILFHSVERSVVRYRDARLATDGMTADAWREELARDLVSDPLALSPYVDARRTLQVVTTHDIHVPTANQLLLYEALGRPKAYFVPIGHYTLGLFIGVLKERIRVFLDGALGR